VARSDTIKLTTKVKNTGPRDGDEVVQIYYRHVKSSQPQAQLALCAFARVHIPAGETAPVSFEIPAERLRYWDTATKNYIVEPGAYEFLIGGASDQLPEKLPFTVR
jgi:beta-glucosidase